MSETRTEEEVKLEQGLPVTVHKRLDTLRLDLANHQRQIISAVEASTDRRDRAANFVRNQMYYTETEEILQENS